MSRKRNPWDNAVIESFFSTLRFELHCRTRFADPDEAERGIGEWIERFYNLHRRHTTLGNVSPINYELAWQMPLRVNDVETLSFMKPRPAARCWRVPAPAG